MKTITTTIIRNPWPGRHTRAVKLPEAVFVISEDDHPQAKVGTTVTVLYDAQDQFANIVTIVPCVLPELPAPAAAGHT